MAKSRARNTTNRTARVQRKSTRAAALKAKPAETLRAEPNAAALDRSLGLNDIYCKLDVLKSLMRSLYQSCPAVPCDKICNGDLTYGDFQNLLFIACERLDRVIADVSALDDQAATARGTP